MNMRLIPVVLLLVAVTSFKPLVQVQPVGLADKYLNDVGIANDPDVLFAEDFNDGIKNIIGRYTEVKNGKGMSTDKNDVPDGSLSPALKITNIGAVNDGGHLYKQLKTVLTAWYMCVITYNIRCHQKDISITNLSGLADTIHPHLIQAQKPVYAASAISAFLLLMSLLMRQQWTLMFIGVI